MKHLLPTTDFLAGETLVTITHISRLYKAHHYMLSALLFLASAYLFFSGIKLPLNINGAYMSLAMALVAFFIVVRTEVKTVYHRYYITKMRVIKMSGILKKDVNVWSIENIISVKTSQSLLGRLTGIGTVDLIPSSGEALFLEHIRGPKRIMDIIYEIIESSKKPKGREPEYIGPENYKDKNKGL